MTIDDIKAKLLSGDTLTEAEAYALIPLAEADPEALYGAAAEVTRAFHSRTFDSCSIINARSGRCGEDCKWCAQSKCFPTSIMEYDLVDRDTCLDLGAYNRSKGIGRFSLVTSGRAMGGKALDTLCSYYRELGASGRMGLCASMGLLSPDSLARLREAGVTRYHCNLETAPSHFPTLCSTHTQAQKLATIEAARAAGMEVCSGGIIGMGETMTQRVEFALFLREAHPVSIPINMLQPIPGTPLEGLPPLSDREILTTVAIFRLIHPRAVLRFAGGRARISPDAQRRALRIGINGAIMGDLLTTIGAKIDEDIAMVEECGYKFSDR